MCSRSLRTAVTLSAPFWWTTTAAFRLLSGSVVKPRYADRRVAEAAIPRDKVHAINQKDLDPDPIGWPTAFSPIIGINKLLVVDDEDRLHGLFTLSDVERITQEASAQFKPARTAYSTLCGAAISASRTKSGNLDQDRIVNHVGALVDRVDVAAVSTAHGHGAGVGKSGSFARRSCPAHHRRQCHRWGRREYLAAAGANCIKIGQGPSSIAPLAWLLAWEFHHFALYTAAWRVRKASPSLPMAASPRAATS